MLVGVIAANSSEQMHHIVSIQESEAMRMNPNNWLAVCLPCHDAIEGDSVAGMAVKQWSLVNYENVLNEGLR
jgi:5-methylcytosine-specific restriction endonuclease McrA